MLLSLGRKPLGGYSAMYLGVVGRLYWEGAEGGGKPRVVGTRESFFRPGQSENCGTFWSLKLESQNLFLLAELATLGN